MTLLGAESDGRSGEMNSLITVVDLIVLAVCVPVIVRKSVRSRRAGSNHAG
jgi:hypothetical protein